MTRKTLLTGLLLSTALVLPLSAQQDGDEDENGFIVRQLEQRLSSENMTVSISGVDGALSSNARVGEISFADEDGPWLTIRNAELDWNRLALLRGRVNINRLAAESIEIPRLPGQGGDQVETEAKPFTLPDLPVSLNLGELDIQRVEVGEPVVGEAFAASVTGGMTFDDAAIDATMNLERLDNGDNGGNISVTAQFDSNSRDTLIDISTYEPPGGLVSSLLNIEGQPEISLEVQGEGKLDNLDVNIDLETDSEDLVVGTVAMRQGEQGLGFGADLRGQMARVVPERYRPFLEGESTVKVQGVNKGEGAVELSELAVETNALSLSGQLETLQGGFLRRLDLQGQLGDGTEDVPLPAGETEASLRQANIDIRYGLEGSDAWDGSITAEALQFDEISAEALDIDLGGEAQALDDAENRLVTVGITGGLRGLDAEDADTARALGDALDLNIQARLPAGQPVELQTAQISGEVGEIGLQGLIDDFTFDGTIEADLPDLTPLAGLANRDLAGGGNLTLEGSYGLTSGKFDFDITGLMQDLQVGQEQANAMLAGETALDGRAIRDEAGLLFRDVEVNNGQLQANLSGVANSNRNDISLDALIRDLGVLSENASGALNLTATAEGRDGTTNLTARGDIPNGQLQGRDAQDIYFEFAGVNDDAGLRGDLSGGGELGDAPITLAGSVDIGEEQRQISGLDLAIGATELVGDVVQNVESGLFEGGVQIISPDISDAAALALMEAAGSVDLDVQFSAENGEQDVAVDGDLNGIEQGNIRIGNITLDATIANALAAPQINADLSGGNISFGETSVDIVEGSATTNGDTTDFNVNTRLGNGATIDAAGAVTQVEGGMDLALDTAQLNQNNASARLLNPAEIQLRGQDVTLGDIALDVNGGRVEVSGEAGEQLNLRANLANVPLDIANAVVPNLNAGGIVNGNATITGSRTQPNVDFDVTGRDLTAAPIANAGVPPIDIDASGEMTGTDQLALNAALNTDDGVSARVNGTTSLSGGPVNLSINLDAFPLAFANRFVDGQNLRGSVTGTGQVTGSLTDPAVSFDLDGSGIGAAPLDSFGANGLSAALTGEYRGQALNVTGLQVNGPAGLTLNAQGSVPFNGGAMNVNAQGALPLDLLDQTLASRNARADGVVNLDIAASGALSNPQLSGTISTSGATYVDAGLNIRVENIALDAALAGDTLNLNSLSAELARGGTINASGTMGIAAPFPADIDITMRGIRYTDGDIVATRFNGDLSIDGPIYGAGLVSGRIDLSETEISIPQGFGGSAGLRLGVEHVNAPPAVEATLARAAIRERQRSQQASPTDDLRLDIEISAPERVFVRGRGLDSELGGSVQIEGTVGDPAPIGQFELNRGRLNLLGQRIDLDEGTLTLNGTLTPRLRLVALTQSSDVTAQVIVAGPVNDLDLTFQSTPELPEDEVLARVIFDRSISELSAFQLAQLAAAVSELTGGGDGGVMSEIRETIGFDNLDVKTDEDGETAVQAGKYLSDDVYTTIETNSAGTTEAGVSVDITEHIRGRISVDNESEGTIGIYYERDY
ncbi:translocation/assembly module TamB domain-containing protein [Paracoccaceae bacterium GXU_MW_L88]